MSSSNNVHEENIYEKTYTELNSVGSGFCLAKWTQVTMHLQLGHTHSCHHPITHKIPLDELKKNPTALHNTSYKKEIRKQMLDGLRPAECEYCWNIEDNSNVHSDRTFKSTETWSYPQLEEIKNSSWDVDINPRYVEVAFSNTCNFKCSYCAPQFSTTWMEEIKKYGGYPTTDKFNDPMHMQMEDKFPILQKEHNPYVEAFWKWWPDLYRDLHTFRITGGEPLLSKDTWGVLDYIIEEKNPNRKLNLAINSNLGVPDNLIDNFIEKIKRICDEERVNQFIVFTSVDTWGKQAEYIRHGLEFNRFWDNVNKIFTECDRVNITFMSTYNALSVPNYHKLIEGVYQLKSEYSSSDRYMNSPVMLDTSYLRHPAHQTVQILPRVWADKILEDAQLMDFYEAPRFEKWFVGFSSIEIEKMKRIYDWMISVNPSDLNVLLKVSNFAKFIEEHDRRRNTNFKKTFPELADFYEQAKKVRV
jgi:sulfatase maturation enzyme AslB (radical SAM superfamily)